MLHDEIRDRDALGFRRGDAPLLLSSHAACYAAAMQSLSVFGCLVLLVFSSACEGDRPAPVEKARPEYRNPAAEYLLAEAAKKEQKRRDEREAEWTELREIRAGFPRAFVDFPNASVESGFEKDGIVRITQKVGIPVEDAWKRAKDQAKQSGWQLEVETESDKQHQASFLKGSQRVELSVVGQKRLTTQVVATLLELDREKAPPATE